MSVEDQLMAVGPLDGRYAGKMGELAPLVSEFGLIRYRATVELSWLGTLGSGVLPDTSPLSDNARDHLDDMAEGFSLEDAIRIKEIEKTTNHDVKSVEIWLREKIAGDPAFEQYAEFPHFGATSEDVTNLAYALMLRDARDRILLPALTDIDQDLDWRANDYADVPMLSRTHGQPASPTTLGKEMAVFSERVGLHAEALEDVPILGKFNGATGNHNALAFAYPEVDWPKVTQQFVLSLGLDVNEVTTQIEPHDWTARFLNEVALGNTILMDAARDMWTYISMGYFKQRPKAGEVGSSTMPHKVNPIDFENAEANLGLANSMLIHLAGKLPVSRLQRDLSDSSAQRAIGAALGHTHLAHQSFKRGMSKSEPDFEAIRGDLADEWSILTEAVQTVMKRHGVKGAYEAIKEVSRGKALTEEDYLALIDAIEVPEEEKARLRDLTPLTYTGYAAEIARSDV